MTRFSFSSLRVRLVALVLLAVLPAFGLILFTGLEDRRRAAAEVQDNALRLARLAASGQDRLIEGVRQLLPGLALLPQVRDGNTAGCNALLAELLTHYPFCVGFAAAQSSGDVYCSVRAIARPGRPRVVRGLCSSTKNLSSPDIEARRSGAT